MDGIQNQLSQVWFWWKEQLRDLVPGKVSGKLTNTQKIYILNEDVDASLSADTGQRDRKPFIELLINPEHHKDEKRRSIVLHLSDQLCFAKSQTLPMAAKPRIRQLLSTAVATNTALDVENHNDYLTSWSSKSQPKQSRNRFNGTLFVLKRQLVDQIFEAFKQAKTDLKALTVNHDGAQIDILPHLDHPKLVRQQTIRSGLIALLAILLIGGSWITATHIQSRQEHALDDLDQLLEVARARAKLAKQKVDARNLIYHELSDLRKAKGGQHSIHEVLERVTGALPDDVWLTELRLKSKSLSLSGFATSAADIIKPLETVSVFSNVKFTAPIVRSAQYNKERFSVQISTSDHNTSGDKNE